MARADGFNDSREHFETPKKFSVVAILMKEPDVSTLVVSRSVSHLSLITFCLHFSMAGGDYLALVQERAERLRFYTWIGNEP